MAQDNSSIGREFYDAWNARDFDRVAGLLAPDGEIVLVGSQARFSGPDGGTLLVVTHGGTARATLGTLLELPVSSWGRLAPLGNACWSVLFEALWGWRLERHGTGVGPLVGPTSLGSFEARAKP